jgi:hypothetical protein
MGRFLSDLRSRAICQLTGNSHSDFWHRPGALKYGRPRRCAPFLIVSLSLRINPPDKSFDVYLDKWCHSLENGKKFGTNLAGLANMLSLIHRNLYGGLMCAIWAEVLSSFTNGELIDTATE